MADSNHDEALIAALKDNKGYCMTKEEEAKFDDAFFGNEEEDPATRQQGATGKQTRRRQYSKFSFLFGVSAKGTNGQWVSKKAGKSAIQKRKAPPKQLCTTRHDLLLKASREQEKKERLERRQQYLQQQGKGVDSRELKYKTTCDSQEACC